MPAGAESKDLVLKLFKGTAAPVRILHNNGNAIVEFTEASGFDRVEIYHEGALLLVFPAIDGRITRTTVEGRRAVLLEANIRALTGGNKTDGTIEWASSIFRSKQGETFIRRLKIAVDIQQDVEDKKLPLDDLTQLLKNGVSFGARKPLLDFVRRPAAKANVSLAVVPDAVDEKTGGTDPRWPVLTIERKVKELPMRIHIDPDATLVQRPSVRWLDGLPFGNDPNDPIGDWVVQSADLPASVATETWNVEVVDAAVKGLRTIRDATPLTLLPRIGLADNQWRFAAVVSEAGGAFTTEVMTFQPLGDTLPTSVTFTGFRAHNGSGVSVQAVLHNRRDARTDNGDLGLTTTRGATFESRGASGIRFALQLLSVAETTAAARVGALDLTFSTKAIGPLWPAAFFRAELEQRADFPEEIPVFTVDCELPLAGVDPGGQDAVPGDEVLPFVSHQRPGDPKPPNATRPREAPIVIPIERPPGSAEPVMKLIVEEDTQAEFNQTVRMRIEKLQSVVSDRSVVVIDREPFLVARVDVPRFGAIDIENTTPELANWSNTSPEGAMWELHGGADSFTLVLPPQGVGEAMEKGAGFVDVEEGQRADFRFTPPLRAQLVPTFFRQRFAEASWNLRRILGTAGDRAPGAGLLRVEFELLYGMSASVTTPFLRLAEIAARLGHLPSALDPRPPEDVREQDRDDYTRFVRDWDEKRRLLDSRLSVIEPWSEQQTDELQITDDLSYAIRPTADLRMPFDQTTKKGLAGGVTWPFEKSEAGFFNQLLANPHSDRKGNRLVAPAFSALGGWGKQRAPFLDGRLTVISTTSMGRTSYLSIEIIGRIGVYWNRAKKVTVYERSVLPSRQFFSEQEPHKGRAVVRKVREFVELLEPLRKYPEGNTGAHPATRGFVLGCEFKSRVIPVTSRWEETVGSDAFRVPLWRRGAEPADVYPKPHVVLQVAADPETGREFDEVEIDDPENLYFYATAAPGLTSDTDLWPPVPWIDYATVALPAPRTNAGFTNGDVRDLPPADADVVPGLGAFTRRVVPSGRAANVTAERAEDAINAVMRNVTMMRTKRDAAPVDSLLSKVEQVRDLPRTVGDILARELGGERNPLESAKELLKNSAEVKQLEDLLSKFTEKNCADVTAALDAELQKQEAQAIAALLQLRGEVLADANHLLGSATEWTKELQKQATMALDDAFAAFDAQLAPFFRFLENSGPTLDSVQQAFDAAKKRAGAEIDRAIGQVEKAPKEAIAQVRARIHAELEGVADRAELLLRRALGEQTPKLTTAVHDIERKIDDQLAAIDLTQAANKIVDALKAVKSAIDALTIDGEVSKTKAALQDVDFALHKKLADAQTKLKKAVNDAAQTPKEVAKAIGDELTAALPDEATIRPLLDQARKDLVTRAKTACETVRQPIADVIQRVKDQLAVLKQAVQNGTKVDDVLRAVNAAADRAAREAELLGRSITKDFGEQLDEAKKIGDNVLRLVRAVGAPPRVPNLSFSSGREAIAYLFDERKRAVDITPVVAFVNRVSDALQPLGIDLPTRSLLDRVVPADLKAFDLSSIFRDFAGMKLSGLFPNLKLPERANQAVKVTHGIDPQSLRAWLEAEVDVPLDRPATIFSFGPVVLRLLAARFTAHVRVETTPGETARQRASGEISGNWELAVGGTVIATFKNTRLTFDDRGNIHFSISSQNVELNGALQFLTDLIAATGSASDSGFSIEVTPVPPRIRCLLNLPLPDIQAGAFGISNLRLGCGFGLALDLSDASNPRFVLNVALNVGRKIAPFTLTVFILGGGGWLDTNTTYVVGGKIETQVSIGITAGASLAIALGPIRGGVYIYFGVTLEYNSGGGPVLIGIMILISGVVSLLGIVDISISLLLEAQYGGRRLIGRGTVSAKIKICWCFTLEVQETVQYEFGAAAGSSSTTALLAGPDEYDQAASHYIDALA